MDVKLYGHLSHFPESTVNSCKMLSSAGRSGGSHAICGKYMDSGIVFCMDKKLSPQPLMGFNSVGGVKPIMRESSLKQKTSTWGLNHISRNNASGVSLHLLSIVTVTVPLQEWLLIGSEKPYKIVLWLLSLITLFTEHTRHKMLLDYRGFKTKVVENGQEAVDMFIAGNYFDVVFMDMEMPVMDGIQATKKLRAMDVKSLIYGVTASESKTEIQAFIEAGLDECFQKPLTAVVIDSVVKRLNLEY